MRHGPREDKYKRVVERLIMEMYLESDNGVATHLIETIADRFECSKCHINRIASRHGYTRSPHGVISQREGEG